jgi:hypothetical protein
VTAPEEEWRERTKWTPTAEEFTAYLEREVEMAKANLEFLAKASPSLTTLHSTATIARAQEILGAGK